MPHRCARIIAALLGLALAGQPAVAETVLRTGRTEIPPSLGNPFFTVGHPSSGVWVALYDNLVVVGEDGQIAPGLAESWTVETPTRWLFRLRDGIVFHDGSSFEAQDAVDVLTFLQRAEAGGQMVAREVTGMTRIEAVDRLTLAIETATPDPILAKRLSIIMLPEPSVLARPDGLEVLGQSPVGTGPFRLVEWGQTSGRILMQANTESWRAPVGLDRLEMVILPDPSARLNALLSGQIDLLEFASPDDVALAQGRGFKVERRPSPGVASVTMRNVGNPESPFQDVRVRLAANLAVDREAIVAVLLSGSGAVASQGASPMTFGYNPDLAPYPHDPARARALLAEAGHADGIDVNFEAFLLGANDAVIYQKIAQDLTDVGIRTTLRAIPFPNWLRKYSSGDWGDVDLFSWAWDSGAYNDVIRPIRNASCDKPGPFFCAPELMPLIQQSDTTMDPDARAALLRTIMARLHELVPSIWIAEGAGNFLMSPKVEAFHARPHGVMYETISLAP